MVRTAAGAGAVLVLWAMQAAGCAPDLGVAPQPGQGGGATTGNGGGAGGAGGAGVGGAGGAGVAGGGGAGGAGGSIPAGCDLDNDGELSVNCTGGTDCDDDGDGYDAIASACVAGNDCDDTDPAVHPNQLSNWFDVEHPIVGFDWDCSGAEEREFNYVNCSGGLCTAAMNVFLQDAACGTTGAFGNCNGLCNQSNVMNRVRRCR